MLALLGGLGAAVAAQGDAAVPGGATPFTLTATVTSMGGPPPELVDDVLQTRGFTMEWLGEASDPRLSGEGVTIANVDAYQHADPLAGGGPEIAWGTVRIDNADGAWAGTYSGIGIPDQGRETVTWWLTGEGAYEGLGAFVEQVGHPRMVDGAYVIETEGWIFPGAVPGPSS
jgi:hypothetical protein